MNRILQAIQAGINAYQDVVLNMTDRELYFHCFNGDTMEDDFCNKELKKRGIEQFRSCDQCQNGCANCNGTGLIPTFE